MLNTFKVLSLFFLLTISSKVILAQKDGKITVELSNVRSTKGVVYIFIYNYKNQYPRTPYTYFKVEKKQVKNGMLSFEIPQRFMYGKYAISMIDDENNNDDFDFTLGIPVEGFGFSNNAKPFLFIPPEYNDLEFILDENSKRIGMKMQYLL